jgi:hypothetical protein
MKYRVNRALRNSLGRPVGRAAAMLIVFVSLWTVPAFAQGCAMCYTTAAAASKDGQMAIDRAVAVLLAPPLGFMTLGVGLAFRYGRKRDFEQNRDDGRDL